MGWTHKEEEQHKCKLPIYERAKKYDRWKCDECGTEYIVTKVHYDQRDGYYLSFQEYESWKSGPFPPGTK